MLHQESRKHRRLMKRSAQLDWEDLKEIARMKGVNVMMAPPESAAPTSTSPPEGMDEDESHVSEAGSAAEPGEALPTGEDN